MRRTTTEHMRFVLARVRQAKVSCYFVELYLDQIRDLFFAMDHPQSTPPKLEIKLDANKMVFLKNVEMKARRFERSLVGGRDLSLPVQVQHHGNERFQMGHTLQCDMLYCGQNTFGEFTAPAPHLRNSVAYFASGANRTVLAFSSLRCMNNAHIGNAANP